MEDWKITLADNIYTYGRAGKKVGNGYRINIVCMNHDVREAVYHAIYKGVNETSLSTDFKEAKYGNDDLVVWVELGSKQARDEFERNLAAINNEVAAWRKSKQENAKQGNIENSDSTAAKRCLDVEGVILAVCLIGALLLILTD